MKRLVLTLAVLMLAGDLFAADALTKNKLAPPKVLIDIKG